MPPARGAPKARDSGAASARDGGKRDSAPRHFLRWQSLKADIKAIQARYAAEEKKILALQAEEAKDVAEEKKLLAKVTTDQKVENAEESKELLKEEVEATEAAVDAGAVSFLKSFFK